MGQTVDANETLFTILDLSSVWVDAKVYEKDVHKVKVGQLAEITASAYPGEALSGQVYYIGDTIDEKTRTLTVRCEIVNPNRKLKPRMFVTVKITTHLQRGLVIPIKAVQTEEGKTFVYVALGGGEFERREVKLGEESNGLNLVLAGLRAGERVVTDGAFLLKSEGKKEEFGEHEH